MHLNAAVSKQVAPAFCMILPSRMAHAAGGHPGLTVPDRHVCYRKKPEM